MKLKILFIIYILSFFSLELYSQQYPIIHYTRDKSLPGNQVWSIFQDSKGYMWFATSAGLIKYNGKDYKIFRKKDGLLNDWPLGISEDIYQAIWVSSDKGISRIKNGKIKNWMLNESEDRLGVNSDSYGRVWVYNTLFPGDIFYFKGDSLYNFSDKFNFKNQVIMNVAEDNDGNIFFLTRKGKLFRFFTDKISEINLFLPDAGVRYAFFDSHNNLILCTQNGLGVIPSNELYNNPRVKWVLDIPVNHALQSKNKSYWIATNEKGLIRLKDIYSSTESDIYLSERNGILSNSVKRLYEDSEGNIWLGYDLKGISKISTLMFKKYEAQEGLDANAVFTVTKANNIIYCLTEKGIFKFNNNKFELVAPSDELSRNWFLSLLPLNNKEFLIGSVPGLYKLVNGSEIKFAGLENKMIQSMIKDHNGKIWIGTHEGLFTMEGDNFVEHESEIKGRAVFSLVEINDKDIYAGTDKGLFILKNASIPFDKKTILTPGMHSNSLLTEFISDLKVDSDGSLLIASSKGLKILKSNKLSDITELNEIEVISIEVDSNNRLWAGTTSGLYLLQKYKGSYSVKSRFTKSEGLASNEFSFNQTIYEDNNGKIYFGMFGGIALYDPSEDHSLTAKPKSYITGLKINDSTFTINKDQELVLSHSQNKLSFYCDALSFFNEDAVKFEYYLSPVESEWSNSSSSSTITYGYLEPNEYTFHVRAVNQFGILSDAQEVSFTISPPFWKSSWFITGSVMFLVLAGFQFNQFRQKHIQKRNLILEKLVTEKTRDLEKSKTQVEQQYHQLIETQKELVEKRELEKAHSEIQLLKERLTKENIYLREKQGIIQEVSSIIGSSPAIQEVRKKVVEIAGTDSTVLITGNTGVGKNLVAEAIHDLSSRKERAMITVNCAAIPESLVESELFGHEKGAFTGATSRHEGKFEVADGSTIFLDEIGDMPLNVQVKLLNVLQSKKFSRVGGTEEIKVDLRIIAATNHNLLDLVEKGKFRKDLYYRINIYTIHIPELKERRDDIEPIAKYFIGKYSRILNKKINAITKSALSMLQDYTYPGNIRELENIIHRAVIICKGNAITDDDVPVLAANRKYDNSGESTDEFLSMEEMERQYIMAVLRKTNWKIRGEGGAAEILKMDPGTLRSRMKKLSVPFISDKKA